MANEDRDTFAAGRPARYNAKRLRPTTEKKGERVMRFLVVLEKAEEGGFNVSVPALDGCFTQAETEEEAVENAREAILCYLKGLEKVNQIKAKPGLTIREVELVI